MSFNHKKQQTNGGSSRTNQDQLLAARSQPRYLLQTSPSRNGRPNIPEQRPKHHHPSCRKREIHLNTSDYHTKITILLADSNTHEMLRRDPITSYKKKVIGYLQKLENKKAIICPGNYRIYPGEATPCIYSLPNNTQIRDPTLAHHKFGNLQYCEAPHLHLGTTCLTQASPTFRETTPSHWFRYVSDTWVIIKS